MIVNKKILIITILILLSMPTFLISVKFIAINSWINDNRDIEWGYEYGKCLLNLKKEKVVDVLATNFTIDLEEKGNFPIKKFINSLLINFINEEKLRKKQYFNTINSQLIIKNTKYLLNKNGVEWESLSNKDKVAYLYSYYRNNNLKLYDGNIKIIEKCMSEMLYN